MRLSLMKAAHARLGKTSVQEIRVSLAFGEMWETQTLTWSRLRGILIITCAQQTLAQHPGITSLLRSRYLNRDRSEHERSKLFWPEALQKLVEANPVDRAVLRTRAAGVEEVFTVRRDVLPPAMSEAVIDL
jgi:hypothetical protein